jgi:hypothetical protein
MEGVFLGRADDHENHQTPLKLNRHLMQSAVSRSIGSSAPARSGRIRRRPEASASERASRWPAACNRRTARPGRSRAASGATGPFRIRRCFQPPRTCPARITSRVGRMPYPQHRVPRHGMQARIRAQATVRRIENDRLDGGRHRHGRALPALGKLAHVECGPLMRRTCAREGLIMCCYRRHDTA